MTHRPLVPNRWSDSRLRSCCRGNRVGSISRPCWAMIIVQIICVGTILLSITMVKAFYIPLIPKFNSMTLTGEIINSDCHQQSSRDGVLLQLSPSISLHRPKLSLDKHHRNTVGRLLQLQLQLQMTTSSATEESETNHTKTENVTSDSFFMSSTTEDSPTPVGSPSAFPLPATSRPDERNDTSTVSSTNDIKTKSPPPTPPKEEFVETFSKAAWQMGSDFFVALRWGAANALTSSLPDNQRQILLERLDPTGPIEPIPTMDVDNGPDLNEGISVSTATPDTDDGYERVTNSINEAVVASMVTKSQKDEQKWDREKEKILLQAEIAAQKRVETELAIQQQRYEAELLRLAALEKSDADDKDDDDDVDDDDEEEDDDTIAAVRHPVLGPVLYDFGYKRLHLVPADILATIPVWKKQRTYRHERAKSMSIDKMKTLHLGFPGVICIHEERSTGKIAIIDGQHRVGMMKILQEKQKQIITVDGGSTTSTGLNVIDLDHVLVEVYTETEPYAMATPTTKVTTSKEVPGIKDHAQDLFTEINKAEPVKLVDMPGVATSKERKMISQACSKLEDQYTIMFKPSQKCRPPNVNIDNLRDTIFASNILKRHSIQSSSQLYDWLVQQNVQMGMKFTSDEPLQTSLNEKVWNKAQTNEFYLGLDSSWLYN